VFVRNTTSETATNTRQSTAQPAYIERKGVSTSLPTGTRLVARLQNSVSSAVKTPVIAVIEYNYEQGGEILIPAGTKSSHLLATRGSTSSFRKQLRRPIEPITPRMLQPALGRTSLAQTNPYRRRRSFESW